jgi:hypothetical protein
LDVGARCARVTVSRSRGAQSEDLAVCGCLGGPPRPGRRRRPPGFRLEERHALRTLSRL